MKKTNTAGAVLLTLLLSAAVGASVDLASMQDDTVTLAQAYIRVDTVNPPGNESNGVAFFARILEEEGIPFETAESAPGRLRRMRRVSRG